MKTKEDTEGGIGLSYLACVVLLAQTVLKLLEPKLKPAERRFVTEIAPHVYDRQVVRDMCSWINEADYMMCQKEVRRLQAQADQFLEEAKISRRRQRELRDLCLMAHVGINLQAATYGAAGRRLVWLEEEGCFKLLGRFIRKVQAPYEITKCFDEVRSRAKKLKRIKAFRTIA